LRANNDPDADQVLRAAHRLMQERADQIDDKELRCAFLAKITAHRQIVKEAAKAGGTGWADE
jgi:hypothetical protein